MDMYDNQNTYPGVTFFGDMCICIKNKSYNKSPAGLLKQSVPWPTPLTMIRQPQAVIKTS